MKKTKKTIGAIAAFIGIFAAVSVMDGSSHEIAIRFGGVALFAIGCYMAELLDFQTKRQ